MQSIIVSKTLVICGIEIPFIETSALNATNVDTAFRNLVQEIYRLTISGKFDQGFMDGRQNHN